MMKSFQCILEVITEIMINYKEDEVVEEHFQWLCSRYQVGLET